MCMKGWGREGGRGGGEEVTLSVYTNPFSVHLQCFSPTCLHYGDFSVRESVLAFRGREEEEEQEEEEVEACFTCWELGGRVGGWVGGRVVVRQESDSFQSLAALHFTSVGLSQFFRRRRKTSSRAKTSALRVRTHVLWKTDARRRSFRKSQFHRPRSPQSMSVSC